MARTADPSTGRYLLALSRPRFWLYLAGPVLVGVAYAASEPSELADPVAVALFVYFLVPANIFLYGINDIFDADLDAENPKKTDKEVRYRGRRIVPPAVIASAILGLAFLPFLPTNAAVAFVGFIILGAAYSVPPLRFKTTPFLDSLSNGLYVLPAVVAYATIAGSAPPALAIAGGWVWAMGMHTYSAIPDIEPDRRAGIETTATLLGYDWTLAYCAGCWLAATLLMALVHPLLAGPFLLYPIAVLGIIAADVDVGTAYWWFPWLNALAGALLTLGGLWRVFYG